MKNKRRKQNFFFEMKTDEFNWLLIPLAFIFIVSLGGFIATSWYEADLAASQFFEKGLNYEVVKYWSQFYSALGNTELLVVLFILVMILVESLFKYKAEKKPNSKWKRNGDSWLWTIYIIFVIFWISINTYQAVGYNTLDKGFGPGFDNEIMDSTKYKQTGKIIAIFIQTGVLVFAIWWMRFKMVERQDFWAREYTISALKGILFFGLTYLIVAILKWMFGRVYFYNIEFGTLLEKLRTENKVAYDHFIHIGQDKFHWGFNVNGSGWINDAPTGSYAWWDLNGFFKRPQDSPTFPLPVNYAFPSGHVNAVYCAGAIFYVILGKKQYRKMDWKIKTFIVIALLHLVSMNFAVVVMRWHWVSDITFTNMLAILAYPTCNWIVDKIKDKVIVKINMNKNKKKNNTLYIKLIK